MSSVSGCRYPALDMSCATGENLLITAITCGLLLDWLCGFGLRLSGCDPEYYIYRSALSSSLYLQQLGNRHPIVSLNTTSPVLWFVLARMSHLKYCLVIMLYTIYTPEVALC